MDLPGACRVAGGCRGAGRRPPIGRQGLGIRRIRSGSPRRPAKWADVSPRYLCRPRGSQPSTPPRLPQSAPTPLGCLPGRLLHRRRAAVATCRLHWHSGGTRHRGGAFAASLGAVASRLGFSPCLRALPRPGAVAWLRGGDFAGTPVPISCFGSHARQDPTRPNQTTRLDSTPPEANRPHPPTRPDPTQPDLTLGRPARHDLSRGSAPERRRRLGHNSARADGIGTVGAKRPTPTINQRPCDASGCASGETSRRPAWGRGGKAKCI